MDIYPAAAEVIRDEPVDQPVLCLAPACGYSRRALVH